MFLLPALGAAASDSLVLILHSKYDGLFESTGVLSVENTAYLPTLSTIRLSTLVPLIYHVSSGTRLKFPLLYTMLHGISSAAILGHFFAFTLYFRVTDSPNQGVHDNRFENGNLNLDEVLSDYNILDHIREFNIIWVLLTLSLFSIGLHIVIFLHVRSTAPTTDAIKRKFDGVQIEYDHARDGSEKEGGKKRKKLSYWIYDRYRKENNLRDEIESQLEVSIQRNSLSPMPKRQKSFEIRSEVESPLTYDEFALAPGDSTEEEPFLFSDTDLDGNPGIRRRRVNSIGSGNFGSLLEFHACLSEGYGDLWGEIQSRFHEAKIEWTTRVDDFTSRVRQNENTVNAANILLDFGTNSTFNALLHLYAHEEVFRNNVLDRAFPQNPENSALSFYAPQLLCFLLHNAYLSTGKLESWILKRCQIDVYFAHRCYWFLRAWCLQGGVFRPDVDLDVDLDVGTQVFSRNSSTDTFGDTHCSEPDFSNVKGLVKGPTVEDLQRSNGTKFSPEEIIALENLLKRIIQCGEKASRKIEFGPSQERESRESGCLSPPVESSPLQKDTHFTPLDESNQFPSMGHLNAVSSSESHGFLPHSTSSLRLNQDGEEVRSYFLRTTDFLDSLIIIADDLLNVVETKNRTPELRKRLKELEFSMLPSNSIYVPVSGSSHRVWRIVSSESIALSTKERVPCIVYLEVIDFPERSGDIESERLKNWYTARRPSQRLNTLFSKVKTITRKGLKRLRNDFEENQEKLFRPKDQKNPGIIFNSKTFEHYPEQVEVGYNNFPSLNRCSSKEGNIDVESVLNSSPMSTDIGQWLSKESPIEARFDKADDLSLPYGSTAFLDSDDNAEPPRSSLVVFKEDWEAKQNRLRLKSAHSTNPNWRLLPILIKSNDDLRQEQLASQLIRCMANILAKARAPSWLYPYDIVALTFRGGIIEAIPDTISIDSLRKNHPHFTDLKHFFQEHFGHKGSDSYENAKANFVESLAGYSIVCYLLQIKDRHNGNILLDNKGHLIHIDFGFFFLSSPGKNSGFESAPFKLTRDFMEVMDGSNSRTFAKFREICCQTFLELRRNCFQITLLVQMLSNGNEDLDCFRGKPEIAAHGLQQRFRLDLSDKACVEYVNNLIDNSAENWTTTWYDRYQRCFVGVM